MSARGGKHGFEVKVSGSINHAILTWDDGNARDTAVVTNENDNSTVTLEGESEETGGWSVGIVIDLDIVSMGSSELNQRQSRRSASIEPGEVSVWIRNEQLGQISVGLTNARGASGGANESDLSNTEVAAYVGVTDIGGNLFLHRSGARGRNGLAGVTWDDLIDSLDTPDGNVIAYDSPELAGFSFSTLWGEDDVWNTGLAYRGNIGGHLEIAAAAAYNENHQGERDDLLDHRVATGSVSLLHTPTGLNLSFAAGQRQYLQRVSYNDGSIATPDSPFFHYLKAGWRNRIFATGETAFYAEFGRFFDFLGRDTSEELVAGLRGTDVARVCAGAGQACLVSASEAAVWGLGIVQSINTAGTQLYLGYRHFDTNVDLVDASNAKIRSIPVDGLETVIGGVLIEF